MHPEAAKILGQLGGDPSGFVARQLTPRIVAGADLVLAMTREHRSAVLEQGPRQLHRTFTLTEAARLVSEFGAQDVKDLAGLRPQLRQDEAVDIPDPIGQDPEFFTRVAMLIAELLEPVMELCRHSSTN
jgi:protein-tyrosine phosphatase